MTSSWNVSESQKIGRKSQIEPRIEPRIEPNTSCPSAVLSQNDVTKSA